MRLLQPRGSAIMRPWNAGLVRRLTDAKETRFRFLVISSEKSGRNPGYIAARLRFAIRWKGIVA